ncbi:CASP-like protein 4D1 [Momordica charantia]|uniref:CASP-like protein n=1 Tax=Momordica charantia TaxID=3673 RepID=A0A6J1BZ60_MOMCH|nr:CASP-like protein 4D1 [Momordica charantia]
MEATITMGSKIASLVLRVVTFVFLFISIIVLATNSQGNIHFHNVNSYRFAMATIIIGGAFNLLQIALSLYYIISKSHGNLLFYFYGDKVLSYVLLSGAAAGLGGGIDLNANIEGMGSFFGKGNAAAALLLIAFLCSAAISILSSLALSNKPN